MDIRMEEGKEYQNKGEEERRTRLKQLLLKNLSQMSNTELQSFILSPQFCELSPELYRHLDAPNPEENEVDKCSAQKNQVQVQLHSYSESLNPTTYAEKLSNGPVEVRSTPAFIKKQDISEGQEHFPISVINTVDAEEAPLFNYINKNIFADDLRLKVQSEMDDCCDCVDDCRDKLNCRCFLRTLNHYYPALRKKVGDENIGYDLKRLPFQRRTLSGIFECNKNCKCKETCVNRVVQLGARCRLQLFKVSPYKGWGVKALTDIPAGTFISNYSGMIIRDNAKSSVRLWKQSKDCWWKYLIKLEIQTPIQNKREQLVLQNCVENINEGNNKVSSAASRRKLANSPDSGVHSMNDEQVSPLMCPNMLSLSDEKTSPVHQTTIPIEYVKGYERDETAIKKVPLRKSLCPPSSSETNFKKYWPNKSDTYVEDKLFELGNRKYKNNSEIVLRPRIRNAINPISTSSLQKRFHPLSGCPTSSSSPDKDFLPKLNFKTEEPFINGPAPWYCTLAGLPVKIAPKIRKCDLHLMTEVGLSKDNSFGRSNPTPAYTRIKTNYRYSFRHKVKKPKPYTPDMKPLKRRQMPSKKRRASIKHEYALDGRVYGNIGRFYNHCCDPNMFAQYVFVDTHDLRFPGVAFFAKKDIRAGEELTWDYNYEINAYAAGRLTIECKCLAKNCMKRLC